MSRHQEPTQDIVMFERLAATRGLAPCEAGWLLLGLALEGVNNLTDMSAVIA